MSFSKQIRLSRIFFLAIIAILLSRSETATAQWKQIGSLPEAMYCAYFFDANHGVAAGVGAIWKYTNGYWSSPATPGGSPSYFTSIRQLRPGILYITSGASYVWESDDSGATWINTSVPSNFASDVYLTKDSVMHATAHGTFARLDSNICILTNNNGSVPAYSTNGGTSWTFPTGYSTIGGLNCYADTCRKMFFASSKQDPGTAYYSLDSGRSWHACGPSFTTDILGGAGGALYHQDSTGVSCSRDGGTTWQFLGGPAERNGDRQLFGFGPKGKYVVAMASGAVWLFSKVDTVQPGDPISRGDTNEPCPISRIPITVRSYTHLVDITLEVGGTGDQTLSPGDTTFQIRPGPAQTIWYSVSPTMGQHPTHLGISSTVSDGCSSFGWIDTFAIYPAPLPILTPNVHVQNCVFSRIPLAIQPMGQPIRMHVSISSDSGWSVRPTDTTIHLNTGIVDTLWLTPTHPDVPIGSLIHLSATDTGACTIYSWDTTFTMTVVPVPVKWTMNDSIVINACSTMRIPITVPAAPCDSLVVDQLSVLPNSGILTPISGLGTPLPRGMTDTLWLLYAPNGKEDASTYQVHLSSHFVPEGQSADTIIHLYAASLNSPHPRASTPASVSMNACVPTAMPLYVRASGCEPIRLDSIIVSQSGAIVTGGLSHPDTIAAGTTDTISYHVEALYPGTHTIFAHCYLYRIGDGVPFDTVVQTTLHVGGANSQALIAGEPRLALSNCTTSVVPFLLRAPDCDSVTISNVTISGAQGMTDTINLWFPFTLSAGVIDSLLVSFPPQGLNQTIMLDARIRGTFGNSNSTFDTTAQTQVTFACAGVMPEDQESASFSILHVTASSGSIRVDIARHSNAIFSCNAEIMNLLGQIIDRRTFELPPSENSILWNVSTLSAGEYYLRLSSGEMRATSKFIVIQ